MGPYKLPGVPCVSTKKFVNNGRLRAIKNSKFFVDGEVVFPPDPRPPIPRGVYRTVFGPCVITASVLSDKSDTSLRMGMHRLNQTRLPDQPGMELVLQNNQKKFMCTHMEFFMSHFSKY